MSLSKSIQEVIDQLTLIINNNLERGSYLGLFPALYRKVTQKVQQGIAGEIFRDNDRMERLDVIFANRYLDAYHNFEKGEHITKSWEIAFHASTDLLYLQHLLIGMNAHINLDLGISAAQTAIEFNQDILLLHEDFNSINTILNDLVNEVQREIGRVAPAMFVLDYITGGSDEKFAQWAMQITRDYAWQVAMDLFDDYHNQVKQDSSIANQPFREICKEAIVKHDLIVWEIGKLIVAPPGRVSKVVIKVLKFLETGDVKTAIKMLSLDETKKANS